MAVGYFRRSTGGESLRFHTEFRLFPVGDDLVRQFSWSMFLDEVIPEVPRGFQFGPAQRTLDRRLRDHDRPLGLQEQKDRSLGVEGHQARKLRVDDEGSFAAQIKKDSRTPRTAQTTTTT